MTPITAVTAIYNERNKQHQSCQCGNAASTNESAGNATCVTKITVSAGQGFDTNFMIRFDSGSHAV